MIYTNTHTHDTYKINSTLSIRNLRMTGLVCLPMENDMPLHAHTHVHSAKVCTKNGEIDGHFVDIIQTLFRTRRRIRPRNRREMKYLAGGHRFSTPDRSVGYCF